MGVIGSALMYYTIAFIRDVTGLPGIDEKDTPVKSKGKKEYNDFEPGG